MISDFVTKLKESAISVVPVIVIVLLLHFTIAPLQSGQLPQFFLGGILITIGLSIFLIGADIGMVPFGQKVGTSLTYKRNLLLILGTAFGIGFAVTIAEPDVQVLVTQVCDVAPSINKVLLLVMAALGVGLFLMVGMLRIILQIPLQLLLLGFYIPIFVCCFFFVDQEFINVAFDTSGVTTGPVTVPFIIALGLGIAAAFKKKEGDDSSFGLVGIASIGPIITVSIMGMFIDASMTEGAAPAASMQPSTFIAPFQAIFPTIAQEIALALAPLVLIFLLFQVTLLKLPHGQVKRMLLGLFYAFIGLVIFMVGAKAGFSPIGHTLGVSLGRIGSGNILIPVGFVFGAIVVCAEPAVWVLTRQVEEVSGGHIKRTIMLVALSLSIALAIVLSMLRVLTGLGIWYVLLPGYALALGLTFFCPKLFTAVAFDAGGLSAGPMSTIFVLSMTLGGSYAVGGNPAIDAFGMIAMIAMAPLITIQILGIIFKYIEHKQARLDKKEQ